MRKARRIAAATTALALALSACTSGDDNANPDPDGPEILRITSLEQFDACGDLLDHLKTEATERVGPHGIPGLTPFYGGIAMRMEDAMGGAESGVAATPAPSGPGADGDKAAAATDDAGDDFSGTNNQEEGVDEPDIVKTDGKRIFAIAGNDLRLIDASGATPALLATLDLPDETYNHQLFLDGTRLLVIAGFQPAFDKPMPIDPGDGSGDGRIAADVLIAPYSPPKTMLFSVDVSNLAQPAVTSTMTVDGSFVSGRKVGSTARLVLQASPDGLDFVYPQSDGAEDDARAANEKVVSESTIEQWLPGYELEVGGEKSSGLLVDCDQVSRPEEFSGFGTISVMTLDLAGDLAPDAATSVITDSSRGQTIYASAENLYVTTAKWIEPSPEGEFAPPPPDETTAIHMFDITGTNPALYVASGAVRGHLLNQYSMSEHEGVLRVATTDPGEMIAMPVEPLDDVVTSRDAEDATGIAADDIAPPDSVPAQVSESFVTTFRHDGNELVPVGEIGGLGKNEQIYAVRFIGATGYVVTFRRTDPLYTVDLSDPANPRVAGELKINGYSAYLHPAGEGRLIGLGQDADDDGRVKGMQLSLFDVSDPANPTRLQQLAIENSSSEAEYDPHAFLYWDKTKLAVVPMASYTMDSSFYGAVATHIDSSAITEVGRLTHQGRGASQGWDETIRRSMVIGDALYTLSNVGLQVSDLATLAERGWIGLPTKS